MVSGPPPSKSAVQAVDESALFQSLEPAECKKIEEEFEKLTSETDDLERILEVEMEEKRARIAAAGAGGSPVKRKPSPDTSSAASSSIPFAGTLFNAVARTHERS